VQKIHRCYIEGFHFTKLYENEMKLSEIQGDERNSIFVASLPDMIVQTPPFGRDRCRYGGRFRALKISCELKKKAKINENC
jgi:hypothetical protein